MTDRHDEDMKVLVAAYRTAGHMERGRQGLSYRSTADYELLKLWAAERSAHMTEPEYRVGETDYINSLGQFVPEKPDALNAHTALLYYQFAKE